MKSKIPAIVMAACLSKACHAADDPSLIFYRSADSGDLYIALAVDRSEVYLGHVSVDVAPCKIGDEALCIEFDGHLFTVIDRDIATPDIQITGVRESYVDPAGVATMVDRISVKSNDFSDTYWYSTSRGLLAIELAVAGDEVGATFVLVGNCGYGASRDCLAE
jgi:hypothetical protein